MSWGTLCHFVSYPVLLKACADGLTAQGRQTGEVALVDMPSHGAERPPTPGDERAEQQLAHVPWLLHEKIAIPDRPPGYVHRAELVARTTPTSHRLTVLRASGGFGKTTVLAECCRRLRRDGVATAWLCLDERDEPAVLDAYIAFACQGAGLNLGNVADAHDAPVGPGSRIGLVVREIQSFGGHFVIAFDELERLSNPGSVSLLAFLVRHGPPNLHLAFACREIPDGLDVAGAIMVGRAKAIETEDLRFSRADVARFFDFRLSRRALGEEMSRSAGWPLALRVSRNSAAGARDTHAQGGTAAAFVGNWIESRLFAGLRPDERNFVQDLSLFGSIDAELLREVLQRGDSVRRLKSLAVLVGLLESVGDGPMESWRLHPLVREHCAERLLRDDPERFRDLHRRIANARAGRGETALAMRHAVEGNDPFLAGAIAERAGGVRIWTSQGLAQLQEANRLLSQNVVSASIRLKFLRCTALALSGRHQEAQEVYRDGARQVPHGDADPSRFENFVDDCIARYGMALYGGGSLGSDWLQTLPADITRVLESARLAPATRGLLEYGASVVHFLKAEFDVALDRLTTARDSPSGTPYISLYGELLHGQIDFVEGRADDARSHYLRARRLARKWFLLDPVATTASEVALKEIALESALGATVTEPAGLRRMLTSHGVPFSYFATASSLLINARLRDGRPDEALAMADELLGHVRRTGLVTFARLIAALRITVLVVAGRVPEAERAWRRETFPEDVAGCVDMSGQSWREMAAIAEARTRLLIASRRYEAARTLLAEWRTVAMQRRLRTIEMRCRALLIVLEQQAGEPDKALGHLVEYLRLFAGCPYSCALVQERAAIAELVRTYLDRHGDSPGQEAARSILAAMRRLDPGIEVSVSERERDVLRLLAGRADKEIAAALGLTVHGVRYHLRSLYAKLGVGNRTEALRRAEESGLIPSKS